MGRLGKFLESMKISKPRRDKATRHEERALDRWEDEGGPLPPPEEDPRH